MCRGFAFLCCLQQLQQQMWLSCFGKGSIETSCADVGYCGGIIYTCSHAVQTVLTPLHRCNRLLEPVMLEVKKMRTLSRRGSEMDEGVVMDKTNKYLVSAPIEEGGKHSESAGGGGSRDL